MATIDVLCSGIIYFYAIFLFFAKLEFTLLYFAFSGKYQQKCSYCTNVNVFIA